MDADQNGVVHNGVRRNGVMNAEPAHWRKRLHILTDKMSAWMARPLPAVLCLVAAAVDMMEWPSGMAVYGADTVPWWLCGLMVAALALSAAFPRPGSLSICLLFAMTSAVPWLSSGMFHMSVMAALLNVAITSEPRWRWSCYALAVIGSAFEAFPGLDGIALMFNQAVFYAIPMVVAYALRVKDHAMKAEREAERLRAQQAETERLRERFALSRRIHDSLSGTLSYIALRTERPDGHKAGDDRRDTDSALLADIHDQAMRGLDDVHRIIRMMRNAEASPQDAAGAGDEPGDESMGLRATVDRGRGMLDNLGFHGEAHIDGSIPESRSSSVGAIEANALAGELFANVVRHGRRPGGTWYMDIRVTDDAVFITQTNELGDDGQAWSGGTGLASHAEVIARLGGQLRHSIMDGSWFVSATIPLRASAL